MRWRWLGRSLGHRHGSQVHDAPRRRGRPAAVSQSRRLRSRGDKGAAALEFAILAPFLLLVLGGIVDFGLVQWSRSCLANAVAQGAYYAFLQGSSATDYSVKNVVQNASPLTGVSATATDPACYCASGTPATLTAATNCSTTCSDGTQPGSYVMISAKYTFTSLLPLYSGLVSPVLQETATVRVQ